MKTVLVAIFLVGFLMLFWSQGCEWPGDVPVAGPKTGTVGDTSYVEIFPPWGGFGSPRAMIVGKDQLIYVADYDHNEVIMMDIGGTVLKRRHVPHPISIAQNFKLDLFVGGETIAPNGVDTIGAVYKIALARLDTVYLDHYETHIDTLRQDTVVIPIYKDTSYYADHNLDTAHMKIVWEEPGRPQRRFSGIGILPGNDYLVCRVGNDNSSFIDPDTRVLQFTKEDVFVSPLPFLRSVTSDGSAITDINSLTNILVIPASYDFIVTQTNDRAVYGAIWMSYQNVANFTGWIPKYDPSQPAQAGIDFILPHRFASAMGAAYDAKRKEVFVVDAELDTIVKFDRNGRFKSESFGRYRSKSDQFRGLDHPSSVAYSSDCTLYIADMGNKVIRRFKLSTQLTCPN